MPNYLALAQTIAPQLVARRRDFHQHPEIGFHEMRTAGIVAEHLRALGIETITGIGKTGVVGLIEGREPGPTVLLRVDMDALPITEETGLPYASQNQGLMHACGHDGHTAIGMGVAQLLVETSNQWSGQVKLLFQPAEEGLGGAYATVEDGVLLNPKPDIAFGLHLWNQLPSGEVVVQSGPLMAAADKFIITITGHGGHGAQPHTTIDAILVASQAASALHTIISRNIPPQETAVLTIGSFHAGNAFNVIAERAEMSGTLRTFNPDTRNLLIKRMDEVLAGVTAAHGARYTLEIVDEHTPAVINDAEAAAVARKAASVVVGAEDVKEITPLMVSEDMSEILNRIPGCYILLGAMPPGGARGPHHNPKFDIDEAMLPYAAAILASVAVEYLQQ
jgi:amidohydrolase